MKKLNLKTSEDFTKKLTSYPTHIAPKIARLRQLIIKKAEEIENIDQLEETLKWGEPSFVVKKGSTIRIDWKAKAPEQYAIYFKCTSKLVETFKVVFGDTFRYEKSRAILFNLDDIIPERELNQCIGAALQYHTMKQKRNLGIN